MKQVDFSNAGACASTEELEAVCSPSPSPVAWTEECGSQPYQTAAPGLGFRLRMLSLLPAFVNCELLDKADLVTIGLALLESWTHARMRRVRKSAISVRDGGVFLPREHDAACAHPTFRAGGLCQAESAVCRANLDEMHLPYLLWRMQYRLRPRAGDHTHMHNSRNRSVHEQSACTCRWTWSSHALGCSFTSVLPYPIA